MPQLIKNRFMVELSKMPNVLIIIDYQKQNNRREYGFLRKSNQTKFGNLKNIFYNKRTICTFKSPDHLPSRSIKFMQNLFHPSVVGFKHHETHEFISS